MLSLSGPPPVVFDAAGYGNPERVTWVQNAANGGGTYDPEGWGYPWRIVAHTIQGSANPATIATHRAPPQLWYNPIIRAMWQTIPLSRAGLALWQDPNGVHYTNKARAIQVELHGYSEETAGWPQEWLDNITFDLIVPICQWVAKQGASIDLCAAPAPGPIGGSAAADAPQRMTDAQWAVCNTLVSHRHVPQNADRWDTGSLDTPRIAQHAALIIGGMLDSIPGRSTGRDLDVAVLVQVQAPGDPLHESVWVCNGLFKRLIVSAAEIDDLIATGQVTKQPNGAAYVSWPVEKIRGMATIDEWSIAGMPGAVLAAVGRSPDPKAIAGAVVQQVVPLLPQTSPQFAVQLASAVAAQIPQADPQLADKIATAVSTSIVGAIAALPEQIAEAFTAAFAARRVNPPTYSSPRPPSLAELRGGGDQPPAPGEKG